jgi:methylmalonyl-CoA mutase
MATNLFDDFDPVSSNNGNKNQFELKGADYNETLIWNSPEDIKVKPFIIEMSLQSTCCNH